MTPETPSPSKTFVRLLGFLRPYKFSLGISIVLAIGSQATALVATFLAGSVAAALEHNERHRLPELVVAILVLGVLRALMMAGRRLIAGKQALGVELDMRTVLHASLVIAEELNVDRCASLCSSIADRDSQLC